MKKFFTVTALAAMAGIGSYAQADPVYDFTPTILNEFFQEVYDSKKNATPLKSASMSSLTRMYIGSADSPHNAIFSTATTKNMMSGGLISAASATTIQNSISESVVSTSMSTQTILS